MHVTCLAHALNLVAEKVRHQFEDVDKLISSVKKIFVKARLRTEVYREMLEDVPLPPQPVLTRWGTWLQTAIFYSENFDSVKEVVISFEKSSADAIKKPQTIMANIKIKNDLIYIRNHFKIIQESIAKLEKKGAFLTDSMEIIENIFNSIKKAPGSAAVAAFKKLEETIQKNEGYKYLLAVSKIFINGENVPDHESKMDDIYYKFAPKINKNLIKKFLCNFNDSLKCLISNL